MQAARVPGVFAGQPVGLPPLHPQGEFKGAVPGALHGFDRVVSTMLGYVIKTEPASIVGSPTAYVSLVNHMVAWEPGTQAWSAV